MTIHKRFKELSADFADFADITNELWIALITASLRLGVFARDQPRSVMIKTVRVGDIVGFRTFTSVIRYGEVVDVLARGEGGRPNRRDEISVRLKPDGQVVMVQRWRLAERYDRRKI